MMAKSFASSRARTRVATALTAAVRIAVIADAFIMAIDPSLVHRERYNQDMVTANPSPGTWSAYPNPSSITLYKDGQGYPKFDLAKAKTYFAKVNDKLTKLVQETIRKWDLAGL